MNNVRVPPLDGLETCFFHARDQNGCTRRRMCDECLLRPGCVVSTTGECLPATEYHEALDFRRAPPPTNATTAQQWQFPALSTTYCSKTDPVCATFLARNTTWRDFSDTSFCRGTDGCVVVSACEARALGRDQCELSSPPPPLVMDLDFSWLTGLVVGIVVVSVLLLLGGLWCLYRCCTRARRRRVRLEDGDVELKTQIISDSAVAVDIQNVSVDNRARQS